MKIWCQSAGPLGKTPARAPYHEALVKHVQEVARAGTTVEVHGVDTGTPNVDRYYFFRYMNSLSIIKNAMRAEKGGYDAFCLLCHGDPVFYEIREVVNMPVVSVGEASIYAACLLALKFAPLVSNEFQLRSFRDLVKRYGVSERAVTDVDWVGVSLPELHDSFNDPANIIKKLPPIAERARKQGAGILVCSCGVLNMLLVKHGIKEVGGLPIIDSSGTAVKMSELLVDLKAMGLTRSSQGLMPIPKKDLAEVLKIHGFDV